ncbi:hypothetical protein ACMFMF_007590 [Clarireedia jacksonii]
MSRSPCPIPTPVAAPKPRSSTSNSTSTLLSSPLFVVLGGTTIIIILVLVGRSILPIPYLSPFLGTFFKCLLFIIAPILPFVLAGWMAAALKFWKRREFSNMGSHLGRVTSETWDMGRIFTAWDGENICLGDVLLGIRGWIQWGLIAWVIGCEVLGWRWDAGYIEKCMDALVKEDEEAKLNEMKEKKIVDEEVVMVDDEDAEASGDKNGNEGREKVGLH